MPVHAIGSLTLLMAALLLLFPWLVALGIALLLLLVGIVRVVGIALLLLPRIVLLLLLLVLVVLLVAGRVALRVIGLLRHFHTP